jgi:hypothetical protein
LDKEPFLPVTKDQMVECHAETMGNARTHGSFWQDQSIRSIPPHERRAEVSKDDDSGFSSANLRMHAANQLIWLINLRRMELSASFD